MHNLRRVEAGLRGERMVPMVTATADTDDAGLLEDDVDASAETIGHYPTVAQGPEKMDNSQSRRTQTKQNAGLPRSSEWEDMDSYRRHQDIVQGEMGQRDTGVADASERPTVPKVVAPDEQDGIEKKHDDDDPVETKTGKKAQRRKEREDRKTEKHLRREAREERRREKRSKREAKAGRDDSS